MVTPDESDPDAVAEVLEAIDANVFGMLAAAAAEHNVVISLHIAPSGELTGESTVD